MKIKSTEDRVVDIIAIVIVGVAAICCLYPIIYCASMSLSDNDAIIKSSVRLLPDGFNLESYKLVLKDPNFLLYFKNSIVQTVLATVFHVIGCMTFGYVLTRKNFVFKKPLTAFMMIPMVFGGGLIPSYMLIKSLGLYDTIWALILPGFVSIWDSILARTYIQSTIPDDIIESAVLDGANDFQIFCRIVIPLSTTIMAILALYAAVGRWNDYFGPLVYLPSKTLKPLALYLKEVLTSGATTQAMSGMLTAEDYVNNYVNGERIKYVLIMVSTLPIIVVYPFIQKYFVKGVMLGSVKG